MLDDAERRCLTWRVGAAIKRHSQILPAFGERSYIVRLPRRDFLMLWRKYKDLQVLASRPASGRGDPRSWRYYDEDWYMPIKRREMDPVTLVPSDLPMESKVLHRFLALRQFLSARSYEGGGVRLPGKMWLDGGASGYSITLKDVDQALQITVRAGTLDDVFSAAELVLGAENAPWEVDQYQAERRAEKKKKK